MNGWLNVPEFCVWLLENYVKDETMDGRDGIGSCKWKNEKWKCLKKIDSLSLVSWFPSRAPWFHVEDMEMALTFMYNLCVCKKSAILSSAYPYHHPYVVAS